jgi:hypothetical protein
MNLTNYIILLLILFSVTVSAQQVYFVESYTEDGTPIGAANEWEIKPWGSFLYILLDTEDDTLRGNILYLFVDKKEDGEFQPFDSKTINIHYNQKWVVYNYKFTQTGEYDVYFITADQQRFAGERVKIKFEESFTNPSRNVGRSYYDNCKIIFCRKVLVGGKPLGITNSIGLSNNSGQIYVLLNNYRALNTSKILVDIWRKKNRAYEYDEFVESKKFRINPDWPDTFFKYNFTEVGDYKITVYDENEGLIKSGYFTVTK